MTTPPPGGRDDETTARTDADVEAVLSHRAGRRVPPHLEQDVGAVEHLRRSLVAGAPTPNAELALLLREGSPARPRSPRLVGLAGWFVGLGMGAQVGLASAAAAAGLVAAGATHVLPGPVQDVYDSWVAALLPEDDDEGRDLPARDDSDTGSGTGRSSTDPAPGATPSGRDPSGVGGAEADDGAEVSTPRPVPSQDGSVGHGGAATEPAGGPPAPGSTHGGHAETDAEDAEDEAADAAETAADEAADAAEQAEDNAEEEAEEAADDVEEAEEEADEESDADEDRG
ncbi:hypothetical protein NOK12_00560 [Nocardioides sp. OK12]|uniref:hypothetical protein n=1 Tax=Nocardioides sp. OK12 TaxID=2758661 RepID=UPI0021C40B67|nr:hypothetical protein [Nocardioides sp. OK12]GHJ57537.1 hypothetical protein NOK12_00560 [Nocardioides sp. OK12]